MVPTYEELFLIAILRTAEPAAMKELHTVASVVSTHRRARLRERLRQARTTKKMSQARLASLIGKTQSWVAKFEDGAILDIPLPELDKIMNVLDITGPAADRLRDLAKFPHDLRGVYVETVSDIQSFTALAQKAQSVTGVHFGIQPGLLQCESYIRRVFSLVPVADLEGAVSRRLDFQRALLGSIGECRFILGEAAFARTFGVPEIVVEQAAHVRRLVDEYPNLHVHVLKFDAVCEPLVHDVMLYKFDPTVMTDFVTLDLAVGTATVDDEQALAAYRTGIAHTKNAALGSKETRQLLDRWSSS
jgi:transcriptional regulator with XRE-family HTH domain